MATSINCDDLGMFLGGFVLTGLAFSKIAFGGPGAVVGFIAFFLLSILVLVSFAIIMSATVFKWTGNSRVYEIFDSATIFGQYPLTIFLKGFCFLIAWIIPIS